MENVHLGGERILVLDRGRRVRVRRTHGDREIALLNLFLKYAVFLWLRFVSKFSNSIPLFSYCFHKVLRKIKILFYKLKEISQRRVSHVLIWLIKNGYTFTLYFYNVVTFKYMETVHLEGGKILDHDHERGDRVQRTREVLEVSIVYLNHSVKNGYRF